MFTKKKKYKELLTDISNKYEICGFVVFNWIFFYYLRNEYFNIKLIDSLYFLTIQNSTITLRPKLKTDLNRKPF